MAHAQRLSEEVKTLTARVRELEAVLAEPGGTSRLNSQDPRENPVNEIDTLYEKGFQVVSKSMGSLSIGSEGQANYHGESAATEYLKELLPLEEEPLEVTEHPERITLPYELLELMNAFPFGMKSVPHVKSLFMGFLPPKTRANHIADLYYTYVAWMYDPITRQELEADIFDQMYYPNGHINIDKVHSHRLSAFFMVMAAGVMYEPGPDSKLVAKRYHALAKAALALDPITHEVSCATIQSLLVMFRFHYNLDRKGNEVRWLIIGICSRVALKIGLHRDSSGWNLDPEEQQRRRRLFWELYMNDTWTSIVNGRPPSMMIQHTDCQFPDDLEPSVKANGETEIGWHNWKSRYAASCLSISVQHIFMTKKLPYAALLDLDKKIRKFPVPFHLQAPLAASEAGRAWSSDPRKAMQQYCILCERESNLLYLHRSYFAQALREESNNPLAHRYTASVLATYRSACRLISSLKGLYPVHPEITETSWFFWSGVFSSCIVLGALIVESPACSLSRDALREFEEALPFFQEGSRHCRPANTLPILQTLLERAQSSCSVFLSNGGQAVPERPTQNGTNENPDVYEVLGGRTSVITTRSTSNSPKAPPIQRPQSSSGSSGNGSVTSNVSDEQTIDYYDSLVLDMNAQRHFQYQTFQRPPPADTSGIPYQQETQTAGYPMQYSQSYPSTGPSMQYGVQQQQPGQNISTQQQYYAHQVQQWDNTAGSTYQTEYHVSPTYPTEQHQQQFAPPSHNSQHQHQQQQRQPPPPYFYGNGHGPGQTQDEIWRSFAKSFGLDNI
uniref:Xylanolytic transcriptional activator regulatory domain-containing protein n=1 Tax=Moniliophthora roreri TaxID=221103 RepID=A0A0W0FZD4_MONRR